MADKLKAHYPEVPPAPRGHGKAPEALLAHLEEMLLLLQRSMRREADMEDGPWEAEPHNTGKYHPSIEAWHSKPSKGKPWRVKVSGVCEDASPDAVYSQLCVNEQKMTWDHESVSWTRRTRSFSGNQPRDRVDVESYISLPHLAGLVKPRCFYETRLTRWEPDGSIWSACIYLDEKDPWHAECGGAEFEALAKAAGLPRGKNQPGGGMVFQPVKAGSRFTMVAHTELGGWLPQSPVNNATGEVLAGISRDCIRVVAALPAAQRRAPAGGVDASSIATPPPAAADRDSPSATMSTMEVTPAPSPSASANTSQATHPGGALPLPAAKSRRRIRTPGCRDEAQYSWRWVAGATPPVPPIARRGAAAPREHVSAARGAA